MSVKKDSEKAIDRKRIGNNIKRLRELRGLKPSELADELEIPRSSLSSYESGRRSIPRDVLLKISRYFLVSIDIIEKQELPKTGEIKFIFSGNEFLEIFFPIIKTEEALESQKFEWTCKMQSEYYERTKNRPATQTSDDWAFLDCIERYQDLIEDERCKEEAAINSIGLMYYYLRITKINPKIILEKTVVQKKFIEEFPSAEKEIITTDENEALLDSQSEKQLYEFLYDDKKIIYKGEKYKDLLDYYLALQYVLGVADNDFSFEWNEAFGLDLLIELGALGNEYAIRYLKIMRIID